MNEAIPQLPSGDVDLTAKFFSEKLGFEVVTKYPEQKFLIVRRGCAEIHFWTAPDLQHAQELGRS